MSYSDPVRQREYQREFCQKRRAQWIQENGPCKTCGSYIDLEVDHIDSSTKVSHSVWSWSKVRRDLELAKCQVLCVECHKTKSIEARRRQALLKRQQGLLLEQQHGTSARYKHGHCRCNDCRKAAQLYYQQFVAKVRNRQVLEVNE
jgi:5-methylcytosine-specific restriction endonuclease McrA